MNGVAFMSENECNNNNNERARRKKATTTKTTPCNTHNDYTKQQKEKKHKKSGQVNKPCWMQAIKLSTIRTEWAGYNTKFKWTRGKREPNKKKSTA